MVSQCLTHDSLSVDIDEGWSKQTSLLDSDCRFPVLSLNSTALCGLVIQAFDASYAIDMDTSLSHSCT